MLSRLIKIAVSMVVLSLFCAWPAFAQVPATAQYATVVLVCGTPPRTYSPGTVVPVTIDINGNVCTAPPSGGTGPVPYQFISAGTHQTQLLTTSPFTPTIPSGTKSIDISSKGTPDASNECFYYADDGGAASTSSSGKAVQQDMFGYTGPFASLQFVAGSGAACTITLNYYK